MKQVEFDYVASWEAKNDGMRKVTEGEERSAFLRLAEGIGQALLAKNGRVNSDDIGKVLAENKVSIPHPNLMGVVLSNLARRGLCVDSGRFVRTAKVSGKSRKITEWVVWPPMRRCNGCGEPLVRREKESDSQWMQRRCCNSECADTSRKRFRLVSTSTRLRKWPGERKMRLPSAF